MLKLIVSFSQRCNDLYNSLPGRLEKFIPAITVTAFIAGIFLARFSPRFSDTINQSVSSFIDAYGLIAPIAIFFIFTPSLARLLSMGQAGSFGGYVLYWLGMRRLLACVWGAVFTTIVFRFPLFPSHSTSLSSALTHSLQSFLWTATHSSYFLSIYLGIAVGFLSLRMQWLREILYNCFSFIEYIGQYFKALEPVFMMAIGGYIYSLPQSIERQLQLKDLNIDTGGIDFLGININPHTPYDFILVYLLGAFLVGIACLLWHSFLIGWVKYKIHYFSIRTYVEKYWVPLYPLLWASCSESLGTPLSLYLTKVHFPQIRSEVRSFVVGMGTSLNINGTIICIFVLLGVVANIIGFKLSLIELLFCIPIVFLIAYGVPGIPGELVLFAGPIALCLNLPEAILPLYLALYSGLQLGLPDSFRTGNNVTDSMLYAALLNDVYEKRFLPKARRG